MDKYEISIWQDVLVPKQGDIPAHYEEEKIAIIGADHLHLSCSAFEPKLVENVNGTNTFTFKMLYKCHDLEIQNLYKYLVESNNKFLTEESGLFLIIHEIAESNNAEYDNPFIPLLVNERKIKVHWHNKWYDFVIKDCQKDSSNRTITFTCKDLFINELSKNGFDLTFDDELMNNQGTVIELGKKILEDSDWQIDEVASDTILQDVEEPVYEVQLGSYTLTCKQDIPDEPTPTTISSGSKILVFYNQIADIFASVDTSHPSGAIDLQFAYTSDSEGFRTEDGTMTVVNAESYTATGVSWNYDSGTITFNSDFIISTNSSISSNYRAKRRVNSQRMVLDILMDQYCSVYEATDTNADVYVKTLDTQLEVKTFEDEDTVTLSSGTSVYVYKDQIDRMLNDDELQESGAMWLNLATGQAFTSQCYGLVGFEYDSNSSSLTFSTPSGAQLFSISKDDATTLNLAQKHEVYCYTDTDIDSPTAIVNILANSHDFTDTKNWALDDPILQLYPLNSLTWATNPAISYLKITQTTATTNYNNGIIACSNFLEDGLQTGDEFIIRWRARANEVVSDEVDTDASGIDTVSSSYYTGNIDFYIGPYQYNSSNQKEYSGVSIITTDTSWGSAGDKRTEDDNWYSKKIRIDVSYARKALSAYRIGFFLNPKATIWLENIQMFRYVQDPNNANAYILPDSFDASLLVKPRYNFYDHSRYIGETDPTKVALLYRGTEIPNRFTPVYNKFRKVRSITGKQSNRFNLLQTLAEQFNCWVRFDIQHDETGKTKYTNGVPQKFVTFKKEIGQQIGYGFIYGIDLQSIKRQLQSDNIVTKTIVMPNNNEFAQNGSCNIARSTQNYSQHNIIYNFDYYIGQGFIDKNTLNSDLYSTDSENLGYYPTLRALYTEYDELSDKLVRAKNNRDRLAAYQTLYDNAITAAEAQQQEYLNQISNLMGYVEVAHPSDAAAYIVSHWDNDKAQQLGTAWQVVEQQITEYRVQLDKCDQGISSADETIAFTQQELDNLSTQIKEAHLKFYKKYSRFIQEGSWIDDKYVDDNLYYIDAVELAYRSARPKVTYTISVARLSGLDEFKNKVFHLGDITHVEDKEFFGVITKDNVTTPHKELVIISELTSNFEEPSKDSIKVQNYKSSFDDLFKRVNAATQSLQFSQGNYARAAGAITKEGSIKPDVLQTAFDSNKSLAMSATNDTVVQDANGITVSANNDPSRRVRVNSNGVFISTDGGLTWKNAIRGSGVATEALTAGRINTEEIFIGNSNSPYFRWDFMGINAYKWEEVEEAESGVSVYPSTYVRFDQFGLYGIDGYSDTWAAKNLDEVYAAARFGITWDKMFMKAKVGTYGNLELTSEGKLAIQYLDKDIITIGALTHDSYSIYNAHLENDWQYGDSVYLSTNQTIFIDNPQIDYWFENLQLLPQDPVSVAIATSTDDIFDPQDRSQLLPVQIMSAASGTRFDFYNVYAPFSAYKIFEVEYTPPTDITYITGIVAEPFNIDSISFEQGDTAYVELTSVQEWISTDAPSDSPVAINICKTLPTYYPYEVQLFTTHDGDTTTFSFYEAGTYGTLNSYGNPVQNGVHLEVWTSSVPNEGDPELWWIETPRDTLVLNTDNSIFIDATELNNYMRGLSSQLPISISNITYWLGEGYGYQTEPSEALPETIGDGQFIATDSDITYCQLEGYTLRPKFVIKRLYEWSATSYNLLFTTEYEGAVSSVLPATLSQSWTVGSKTFNINDSIDIYLSSINSWLEQSNESINTNLQFKDNNNTSYNTIAYLKSIKSSDPESGTSIQLIGYKYIYNKLFSINKNTGTIAYMPGIEVLKHNSESNIYDRVFHADAYGNIIIKAENGQLGPWSFNNKTFYLGDTYRAYLNKSSGAYMTVFQVEDGSSIVFSVDKYKINLFGCQITPTEFTTPIIVQRWNNQDYECRTRFIFNPNSNQAIAVQNRLKGDDTWTTSFSVVYITNN